MSPVIKMHCYQVKVGVDHGELPNPTLVPGRFLRLPSRAHDAAASGTCRATGPRMIGSNDCRAYRRNARKLQFRSTVGPRLRINTAYRAAVRLTSPSPKAETAAPTPALPATAPRGGTSGFHPVAPH